jgi:hypothetical protein
MINPKSWYVVVLALTIVGQTCIAADHSVPGIHGQIVEMSEVADSQPSDIAATSPATADLSLTAMSAQALSALKKNPRPHLDYECRFSISLLNYPPAPGPNTHDPITLGDTENRLDWEFDYMKQMSGDSSGDEIAKGLRMRILKPLHDDGLCWIEASSFAALPGIWANHWTTGKLLISFANDYRRTQDESIRKQARKMFEGLRARADWVDGRAYYAGGNSCWNEKGWAITDATPYSPAMLLESIVTYYEVFQDEDALKFAVALAEGEMACEQWNHWIMKDPSQLTAEQKAQMKLTTSVQEIWPTAPMSANVMVRPDGSFDHHSHMRGHQGWGMAHLAAITKEPRLVAWNKRLLDFYLSRGTDYGWIPESMTFPRRSETCAVADVINMTAYMAQCGYPDYWDTVERFVRNYIHEAQFFVTPEYEQVYRSLHPGEEGDKGLEAARDFEGGFQGAMGINDRCYAGTTMDMMGCCVPEGMRSIYTAWSNTMVRNKSGVSVNMCFDRDAPEAKVTSFAPKQGRMSVTAKVADSFRLRPPSWAPRDRVKAYRNGTGTELKWDGSYVVFEKVAPNDVLTLTWPVLQMVQKQNVKNEPGQPDREIAITWQGNTVLKLDPPGAVLPLYQHPTP